MSVRWQTFSFISIHTKHFIPTTCHLLHSPHPIPGAASRRPPRGIQQGRDKQILFFYVRKRRLESVVKRQPVIWIWFRVSYTKSRGLLSRIIIKIIQRISPVSKITGYLFTTDSSPLSPHKKTESTCSGLYVIHQTLTPEPVTASLSVQLRCAAFPPLPADVSGGLPVGSA